MPEITAVVPTLNEEASIPRALERLVAEPGIRVLVSDGGSTDNTMQLARRLGAETISCPPGRAEQMNRAAAFAEHGILIFVHADTELPPEWPDVVRGVLEDTRVVLGAFRFATDLPSASMRVLEWLVWLRCRFLHLPYGDQALFLRCEDFEAMGGFPDMPLLEDYEFVRRARRRGAVVTSPVRAVTSGRLWRRLGVLRMTWRNTLTLAGYHLGLSPERLAEWRRRPSSQREPRG